MDNQKKQIVAFAMGFLFLGCGVGGNVLAMDEYKGFEKGAATGSANPIKEQINQLIKILYKWLPKQTEVIGHLEVIHFDTIMNASVAKQKKEEALNDAKRIITEAMGRYMSNLSAQDQERAMKEIYSKLALIGAMIASSK